LDGVDEVAVLSREWIPFGALHRPALAHIDHQLEFRQLGCQPLGKEVQTDAVGPVQQASRGNRANGS
jgi:hypothetical protein